MANIDDDVWFDALEDLPADEGDKQEPADLSLHRAAFDGDLPALEAALRRCGGDPGRLEALDPHGNTALHVAALRGHEAAVAALLDTGVPAAARSARGWTPLDEAVAAKARGAARLLARRAAADGKLAMKRKRAELLGSLRAMPDYSLQLRWSLGSSVPGLGMLLRRYAPHDTYTLWKVGDKLRVDGSLTGVDTSSGLMPAWKRGHFSLVVDGSPAGVAAAAAAAAEAVAAAAVQRRASEAASAAADAPSARDSSAGGGGDGDGGDDGAEAAAAAAAAAAASSTGRPSSSGQGGGGGGDGNGGPSDAGSAGGGALGGPRLLFLNHGKGTWLDLSADKKALKAELAASEGGSEEEQLDGDLAAALERDVGKTRLKPRDFKFAPVKGWLGGPLVERIEGWRCAVYEATARLTAETTSKTHLALPPAATFEAYLAAEYEPDAVTTAALDPLGGAAPPGAVSLSTGPQPFCPRPGEEAEARGGGGGGLFGGGSSSSGEGDDDGGGGAAAAAGTSGSPEEPLLLDADSGAFDALAAAAASDDGGGGGGGGGGRLLLGGRGRGGGGGGGARGGSSGSSGGTSSDAAGDAGAAAGGKPPPPAALTPGAALAASAAQQRGRAVRARCWMAPDFPMTLRQLLPLLDVIGAANKHVARVGAFLARQTGEQLDAFPVRVQVPLLLTVHVLVSFKRFHRLRPPAQQQQQQQQRRGSGGLLASLTGGSAGGGAGGGDGSDAEAAPPGDFFEVPASYRRKLLADVVDKAGGAVMGLPSGGGGSGGSGGGGSGSGRERHHHHHHHHQQQQQRGGVLSSGGGGSCYFGGGDDPELLAECCGGDGDGDDVETSSSTTSSSSSST